MANLNELHPQLKPWAKWLLDVGRYYDSRLVVTSGFRSIKKQQELHSNWLSGKSNIPAAPPGQSMHNYGLAFDLARPNVDPFQDPLLVYLADLWSRVGGAGSVRGDPVHFSVVRR